MQGWGKCGSGPCAISDLGEIVPRVRRLRNTSKGYTMVLLSTSEEWQRQSSLLLQARPATVYCDRARKEDLSVKG